MIKKLIFILLIVIIIIMGVIFYKQKTVHDEVYFTIMQGETSDTIIEHLKDEHIISSEQKAINYVYENDFIFYPNTYLLYTNMDMEELFSILSSSTSNIEDMEMLTIFEGEQLVEIAQDISELSFIDSTEQEIINYWSDSDNLARWISEYDFLTDQTLDPNIMYPLEGYILPATYPMNIQYTVEDLTLMLLDNTQTVFDSYDIASNDIHSVLTLASIVERETFHDADKPTVASVFINRINADMPLQSDITVLYAMQQQKEQVLYSDLEYNSPYNTYLYEGLPPGPIASPSTSSIEAVINAPSTDYYYFFAIQDTGDIIFSKSYEEHQQVSQENAWTYSE